MSDQTTTTPAGEAYDVFLAMRRRRMHREFLPEPVPEELLERLVYAAGRAPSVRANVRHVVVVTDPGVLKTIRQVAPGFLNNAPAALAVCTDTALADELIGAIGGAEATRLDSGAAAGYVSLAAPALGLGTCVVTSWAAAAIRAALGLPAHIRPDVLLPVGYPTPAPRPAPARFHPVVHRDGYGAPYEGRT